MEFANCRLSRCPLRRYVFSVAHEFCEKTLAVADADKNVAGDVHPFLPAALPFGGAAASAGSVRRTSGRLRLAIVDLRCFVGERDFLCSISGFLRSVRILVYPVTSAMIRNGMESTMCTALLKNIALNLPGPVRVRRPKPQFI